jgi:hypothetical protein
VSALELAEEPAAESLADVAARGSPMKYDRPPARTTATRSSPSYERIASPSAAPNNSRCCSGAESAPAAIIGACEEQ